MFFEYFNTEPKTATPEDYIKFVFFAVIILLITFISSKLIDKWEHKKK